MWKSSRIRSFHTFCFSSTLTLCLHKRNLHLLTGLWNSKHRSIRSHALLRSNSAQLLVEVSDDSALLQQHGSEEMHIQARINLNRTVLHAASKGSFKLDFWGFELHNLENLVFELQSKENYFIVEHIRYKLVSKLHNMPPLNSIYFILGLHTLPAEGFRIFSSFTLFLCIKIMSHYTLKKHRTNNWSFLKTKKRSMESINKPSSDSK